MKLFVSGSTTEYTKLQDAISHLRKIYPQSRQIHSKSHIVEQIRNGKTRIRNFFGPRTLERSTNYSRKFGIKGWICNIYEISTSISEGYIGDLVRVIEPSPPDGCTDKDIRSGMKFKWVVNKKESDQNVSK